MVELFEVGGKVRDELAGLSSDDLDFSVVSQEIFSSDGYAEMLQYLNDRNIKLIFERPEFFAVKAKKCGKFKVADFVLSVDNEYCASLEFGLSKRDFTINAIARPANTPEEIIDPFGGAADLLENKILRSVDRDPFVMLEKSPIRSLRAVRFVLKFGLEIETSLQYALKTYNWLGLIESDNARNELSKIMRNWGYNGLKRLESVLGQSQLSELLSRPDVNLKIGA